MSEREKARERARERYHIDYKGILLNTLVSATSSLTATGLLNFVQSIPVSQMPVVIAVLFVAQVLPKLLVEVNKSYARNKAMRKGFKEGLLNDSFDTDESTTVKTFFSMCDHVSYF